MRLFLAINLPGEVQREIGDASAPLRECAPELAWVSEPRLHLTLKFLGEQPADRQPDVERVTRAVAAQHRDLLMVMSGIGAFPNFRRPGVVWIGVDQDPRLELLHHDLEVAFESIGYEIEGRPFRPHITLARVRTALPTDRARELARVARRIRYRGETSVQTIDLMESELTPSGSVFTALLSAPLRSD